MTCAATELENDQSMAAIMRVAGVENEMELSEADAAADSHAGELLALRFNLPQFAGQLLDAVVTEMVERRHWVRMVAMSVIDGEGVVLRKDNGCAFVACADVAFHSSIPAGTNNPLARLVAITADIANKKRMSGWRWSLLESVRSLLGLLSLSRCGRNRVSALKLQKCAAFGFWLGIRADQVQFRLRTIANNLTMLKKRVRFIVVKNHSMAQFIVAEAMAADDDAVTTAARDELSDNRDLAGWKAMLRSETEMNVDECVFAVSDVVGVVALTKHYRTMLSIMNGQIVEMTDDEVNVLASRLRNDLKAVIAMEESDWLQIIDSNCLPSDYTKPAVADAMRQAIRDAFANPAGPAMVVADADAAVDNDNTMDFEREDSGDVEMMELDETGGVDRWNDVLRNRQQHNDRAAAEVAVGMEVGAWRGGGRDNTGTGNANAGAGAGADGRADDVVAGAMGDTEMTEAAVVVAETADAVGGTATAVTGTDTDVVAVEAVTTAGEAAGGVIDNWRIGEGEGEGDATNDGVGNGSAATVEITIMEAEADGDEADDGVDGDADCEAEMEAAADVEGETDPIGAIGGARMGAGWPNGPVVEADNANECMDIVAENDEVEAGACGAITIVTANVVAEAEEAAVGDDEYDETPVTSGSTNATPSEFEVDWSYDTYDGDNQPTIGYDEWRSCNTTPASMTAYWSAFRRRIGVARRRRIGALDDAIANEAGEGERRRVETGVSGGAMIGNDSPHETVESSPEDGMATAAVVVGGLAGYDGGAMENGGSTTAVATRDMHDADTDAMIDLVGDESESEDEYFGSIGMSSVYARPMIRRELLRDGESRSFYTIGNDDIEQATAAAIETAGMEVEDVENENVDANQQLQQVVFVAEIGIGIGSVVVAETVDGGVPVRESTRVLRARNTTAATESNDEMKKRLIASVGCNNSSVIRCIREIVDKFRHVNNGVFTSRDVCQRRGKNGKRDSATVSTVSHSLWHDARVLMRVDDGGSSGISRAKYRLMERGDEWK